MTFGVSSGEEVGDGVVVGGTDVVVTAALDADAVEVGDGAAVGSDGVGSAAHATRKNEMAVADIVAVRSFMHGSLWIALGSSRSGVEVSWDSGYVAL